MANWKKLNKIARYNVPRNRKAIERSRRNTDRKVSHGRQSRTPAR